MTPAARVKAAIELLDAILTGPLPADVVAQGYFRDRRYAGSKDRAAVLGAVYQALRHGISTGERLSRSGLHPSARTRVLSILSDVERAGLGAEGPYSPPPVSEGEAAGLARFDADRSELPPHAVAELPEWLYDRMAVGFGPDLLTESSALVPEGPVDFRVVQCRGSVDAAAASLVAGNIAVARTHWSPFGLRASARGPAALAVREGLVEVQDEGSQIAARLVDARPGHRVLDRCAGAGGKTLAMADFSRNEAKITAADVDSGRLAALGPRITRARATGITIRVVPPGQAGSLQPGFDRVLVDVPCSGTGILRRNPDLRYRLTPSQLTDLLETQAGILEEVAPLVGPSGRLVYVTCSILADENQNQINAFLTRHPEYLPVAVADLWTPLGLLGRPESAFVGPFLQLTPHRTGTDGFFVAVLEKRIRKAA